LAVLPGRLEKELADIKDVLKNGGTLAENHIHKDWFESLKELIISDDLDQFILDQVALKFTKCLEDTGVFKQTERSQQHFDDFIESFIEQLTIDGNLPL
jgi:UDPglucose--hexose-1-phosphate uridylyltransferase